MSVSDCQLAIDCVICAAEKERESVCVCVRERERKIQRETEKCMF